MIDVARHTPVRVAPAQPLDRAELDKISQRITGVRREETIQPVVVSVYENNIVHTRPVRRSSAPSTSLTRSIMNLGANIAQKIAEVRGRRVREEKAAQIANIVAVIPAHNEESCIDTAIETLLLQTRHIDLIVVVVNNSNDKTAEIAQRYADVFPQIVVEDIQVTNGKVDALNYAWRKYASMGQFRFMLGIDADVECDSHMVEHLERDLIHQTKAGGVMARYSFRIPEESKRSEKRHIMNQRAEFAMVGIKQQLRGNTSEILGGQATLFRADALSKAALETDGGAPWSAKSSVEDAELTRTLQRLGYRTAVSAQARAWVGPMVTSHAWDKQRKKWQIGHLTDMIRDFHPIMDRRRWMAQFSIGWNLIVRILFFALIATTITLDKFSFNPLWLTPIGLSIVQAVLVACKIPNRRAGEVLRAICFFPGEIYLWKTLSVWLASVMKVTFDIRNNLWERQYSAEAATKKYAASAWMTIIATITVPIVLMNLLAKFVSASTMDTILNTGWWLLIFMTVTSVTWMLCWIFRIARQFSSLAP